ncbi:putative type III effector Hop protein [Gracilibacillus halophilus YIM-C55.5]|uniref:Putative type III effector Hop protein n=1 Tax=Gracilibacillus halophilus YIM-C55.5 TaxID=1308866 RepID=N4WNU1_9BACI|nr:four-carbon acid sugar kinase family protein [Gracilibacillus halophilus]ENH96150.1 putative type III effector Hop protein [Gracilibacillus halophilus YIM-C55.5]
MEKFGIVADDLTGATTVGVLLARSGVPTAAYFNENELEEADNQNALVLSTDSRAVSKEEATTKVTSAVKELKKMGATTFSKRIDTTLRGNIGTEVEAMLDELDDETIAVMVPSMPQSKRILVGGYSIIDSMPLSLTPVANDVRTPVNESHCPTLMDQQTSCAIGSISLNTLLSGQETVQKALQQEKQKGAKIIIVDAVTIEDVDTIAEAVYQLQWKVLAIDPGPFTAKLAKYRGFATEDEPDKHQQKDLASFTGTVLAIAGSASSVTKEQISTLAEKDGAIQIPVSASVLIERTQAHQDEVKRVTNEVITRLDKHQPHTMILETSITGPRIDLAAEEERLGLQPGEAADRINEGLGEIVNQVLSQTDQVRGLYLTGGDTMVHTMKTLNAKGIQLMDYVIPQADLGTILGGAFDGLVVVGKGGLTGSTNTAIQIVERIFNEAENLSNSS